MVTEVDERETKTQGNHCGNPRNAHYRNRVDHKRSENNGRVVTTMLSVGSRFIISTMLFTELMILLFCLLMMESLSDFLFWEAICLTCGYLCCSVTVVATEVYFFRSDPKNMESNWSLLYFPIKTYKNTKACMCSSLVRLLDKAMSLGFTCVAVVFPNLHKYFRAQYLIYQNYMVQHLQTGGNKRFFDGVNESEDAVHHAKVKCWLIGLVLNIKQSDLGDLEPSSRAPSSVVDYENVHGGITSVSEANVADETAIELNEEVVHGNGCTSCRILFLKLALFVIGVLAAFSEVFTKLMVVLWKIVILSVCCVPSALRRVCNRGTEGVEDNMGSV